MAIHLHKYDLPADLVFRDSVAVDSETTGLDLNRDRLCVLQLSGGDGDAHLVHFPTPDYDAPNLSRLFSDRALVKLFHFARFDLAVISARLNVTCAPVYCTKIASRLVRTYTDRHGLKDLCKELLGLDLSKEQQSSDWAAPELSQSQQSYAASDVLHLHRLRERLDVMLEREGRAELAAQCFSFLPTRAALDLAGWNDFDIFSH
ncbi:MAG: ribonuclease D [Alphaproteobacteria bacterium]|jgi:ribonuclease D|nr:ribonuclease D [Alphaproteobacteria bacterium]MDP6517229.1 ribonuclease D [Alphaproteobacteria bacterium]